MPARRRWLAAAICTALLTSACGGDDDDVDTPAGTVDDTAEDAEGDTADDAAAGATITIDDFAFDGVTEVALGTTVVVTNADSTPHTWSAVDGAFDSGSLAPGDSFEFTFTEAGTFDYQCNFHPSMTGTIVVTG